jgi:predicted TPR repeat methyltransferase
MVIGKDFWEKEHKGNTGWLTGTSFESLLKQFLLNLSDIQGKKVLEIGVGRGHCTESFKEFASELYCCDISETALDKVRPLAKEVYQTINISQVPAVDLAISHLVFVHCTDDEILRIINGVNLTENGRFMFQVSGLKNGILTDKAKTTLVDDGSHFFRSIEETKNIIACSNKQFVSVVGPNDILHAGWFDHQWYYVTVQNKILKD